MTVIRRVLLVAYRRMGRVTACILTDWSVD
jgi:hypothetical protein